MVTTELTDAGFGGLRWARGQRLPNRSVYEGAAGLLRAVAEAVLHDLDTWRPWGDALRDELLGATITASSGDPIEELSSSDLSLYLGSAGHAAALVTWAIAAGDSLAVDGARRITARIAELEIPVGYDVISGPREVDRSPELLSWDRWRLPCPGARRRGPASARPARPRA